VHKALVVAGSPAAHEHRKLFRRWFVPASTADETAKITAFAGVLRSHLLKIAAGLKKGEVILTDSPHERGQDSKLENSEAFVYTSGDLIAVHVEKAFFSTANTLTGKVNWARIIVHELSHAYANTKDHSYSWQGLLPRDNDAFKSANDRWIVLNSSFPAVRALTMAQCQENADSWAFFLADCGGALSETERIQALGQRLYDSAGEAPGKAVADRLKQRAA
jgi:Lysine-specific metallo-endopeptidase